MILEMDCGNTRIKWRLVSASLPAGSFDVVLWRDLLAGDYPAALERQALARIRVGSVAAPENTASLIASLRERFAVEPELASVVSPCAGIRCGYEDVARLGVDRWLAVLAAAAEFPKRDLLVVDAGSAITVDLVSPGAHRGGFIGPGLHMMRDALYSGTAKVKVPSLAAGLPVVPGANTADAVSGAVHMMQLGLIEQALARFSVAAQVVLTGGDAEGLIGELPNAVWRPALVLDGLRLALP